MPGFTPNGPACVLQLYSQAPPPLLIQSILQGPSHSGAICAVSGCCTYVRGREARSGKRWASRATSGHTVHSLPILGRALGGPRWSPGQVSHQQSQLTLFSFVQKGSSSSNILQQLWRDSVVLPSGRCAVLYLTTQMRPLGTADTLHTPKGAWSVMYHYLTSGGALCRTKLMRQTPRKGSRQNTCEDKENTATDL